MTDKNIPYFLHLTPEQAEALKPLLDRPDRMDMLIKFVDNMLAARQAAKIIAWVFGVALTVLTIWYYFKSAFGGSSPHGVP